MPRGKIELNIDNITPEDTAKYQEIFMVLAASGVLKLKNVGILLHVDRFGVFQGIELVNHWPWRRVADDKKLTAKQDML